MNACCQVSSGVQEFFSTQSSKKKKEQLLRRTENHRDAEIKLCGAKLQKIINLKKVVGVQL